jgi:crossover junction endodeoxyribonuclease RuvC
MAVVAGLDLSLTSTGIAVLRDGVLVESITLEPRCKSGIERLLEIEGAVKHMVEMYSPELCVIEGYAFARPNQAHQIGELGGIIRRLLWVMNKPFVVVAPAAAKKFATGKGNAKKDVILQQVLKRWGIEFQTSDEADAFVLAKIGEALQGRRDELTAFQAEVIRAVKPLPPLEAGVLWADCDRYYYGGSGFAK